jgi:hypothetical protein
MPYNQDEPLQNLDEIAILQGTDYIPIYRSEKLEKIKASAFGSSGVGINVKDYGAKGDGITDDTSSIQAALDVLRGNTDVSGSFYFPQEQGGILYFPKGDYLCSASLNIYKRTTIQGESMRSSVLYFTNTGDGIKSTWTINSSTAVNIQIRDIKLQNDNASNVGGGFADVGGSIIGLHNVMVEGFKYGTILDQSELVNIDECYYNNNLLGGVWIVNGDDHTPTASQVYTNRIDISHCQINELDDAYGIIDDGGTVHNIKCNNFNDGLIQIRLAAGTIVNIEGNEFEGAKGDSPIAFFDTSLAETSVGKSLFQNISHNMIHPGDGGLPCISIGGDYCDTLTLIGNYMAGANAYKVTGVGNIHQLFAQNNTYLSGVLYDGYAIRHVDFENISATNGAGSPESAVVGKVGSIYTDTTNGVAYMKKSGDNTNTGWKLITQAA